MINYTDRLTLLMEDVVTRRYRQCPPSSVDVARVTSRHPVDSQSPYDRS